MAARLDRTTVVSELLRGIVVGATLFALGRSLSMAAAVAVGFLLLRAIGYASQQAVGDYADHVLLGGGILLGVAFLAANEFGVVWLVAGALAGGWLVVDGIQQLRYGRTREDFDGPPVADGGGPIRGLVGALLGRLLVPFTLGRIADGDR